MPYFGAFWLDLDASNALKSSKEYITNITFGYLFRHVSCSGLNLWRASFLNSTSRNVLPSGLRKLSSGMPLHPFFSFFQQTHPHARACERHCFSRINSSCFISLFVFVFYIFFKRFAYRKNKAIVYPPCKVFIKLIRAVFFVVCHYVCPIS